MNKTRIIILTILFVVLVSLIYVLVFLTSDFNLTKQARFYFLNIGQGDASLIRVASANILIDGGPSRNKIEQELNKALPFFDRTIDFIVLTHPQMDHLNGLIQVLDKFRVRGVILTGIYYNYDEYFYFLNKIKEKNIPVFVAKSDTYIDFGDEKAEILYPFISLAGRIFYTENVNNSSIVLKLNKENKSALFTGDLGIGPQKLLAQFYPDDLKSDILKVPHHGSKYNLDEGFLKLVDPGISVIMAGKNNKYGHPTKEVLEFLSKIQSQVFRTDTMGTIQL